MADQAPPNYRTAPGQDRCDRCFFRGDPGTFCGKWPTYPEFRPSGLCDVFSERSMSQRFKERPSVNPNGETQGDQAQSEGGTAAEAAAPDNDAVSSHALPGQAGPSLPSQADGTVANHATIANVQIFRSGRWNGKDYTVKDIDGIIAAAATMGYRPPVKLGHTEEPGAPAYGYAVNLRREGEVLVADFEDVPEEIVPQIKEKRYDTVSAEIYMNLVRDKKTYAKALRAVALVGAHVPGVSNLKPLSESLASLTQGTEFETVTMTKELKTMPTGDNANTTPGGGAPADKQTQDGGADIVRLQQELASAQRHAEAAEAAAAAARRESEALKAVAGKATQSALEIQKLQEHVESLVKSHRQIAEEKRQQEIEQLVASCERPNWRNHIKALAELGTRKDNPGAAPELVTFQAAGSDQAAPTDAVGVLKDLVRLINASIAHKFTEALNSGEIPRKLGNGMDDPAGEIMAATKDYMASHAGVDVDTARRFVMGLPRMQETVKRYHQVTN